MVTMQKITPCLWYNFNAEVAVNHYMEIFKNAKILEVSRYGDALPELTGKVLVLRFEIEGQQFQALNGGPHYIFSEAVSFSVPCETQAEIDHYWDGLLANGGTPSQCGWLKDRFGVSWQIVPAALGEMMSSGTPEQSGRVMAAFMKMVKFDIAALQAAFDGDTK